VTKIHSFGLHNFTNIISLLHPLHLQFANIALIINPHLKVATRPYSPYSHSTPYLVKYSNSEQIKPTYHSEPEVQNNFIILVYWSHCVYNLFIRAGNGGRWPASVKLVTYLTLPYVV